MKKTAVIVSVLILMVIASLFIPVSVSPPDDTRIILDHDTRTYIAPPCFQNANASNFLEETTLQKALEQNGYRPEGACTSNKLKAKKTSVLQWFLLKTGMTKGQWDW